MDLVSLVARKRVRNIEVTPGEHASGRHAGESVHLPQDDGARHGEAPARCLRASDVLQGAALATALFAEPDEVLDLTDLKLF